MSTALVSQSMLIPGLSHPMKTETKNATCPHSCGRSAAALACRAACTVSTHCRERGKSRSHRVLGRHGRPAQVRRHHLSTETKNATCPHSCGRTAAAPACRATCTVLTYCQERGKSRSHRVLGGHGRPAQVRRHHLSTETKNATCPHSCGRSAAALACRAACTVSTHCRERGKSRGHRVLGRHCRPAQVRRHHLSTDTKNATCPQSCGRSAATLACGAPCTVSTHCRERGRSRSHRVLGRHGRPTQFRRHHMSTETKNATCPHSCGRSAATLAGRGACTVSTHCRERGKSRSHRVLGRHGRPAQVRRHHMSTEIKNATCPHSCGRSAATLACGAALTVSTHRQKRGKSRSHRVLGRHGRPAQVRRHHLSTETKNATCPHSCGRSAATLACGEARTVSTHCRERGKSRTHRVLGRHGRPAQVRRHHLSTETKNATCPHS